jgi:hypothetical protein
MRKVLIVTYYWPPAGGAGVQRVLKFAKYLPQFGWQPIILTVKNPDSPVIDNTLLTDVPKDCIIYRTKAVEPFELYKKLTGKRKEDKIPSDVLAESKNQSALERFLRWVRLNLFIPDAKIGWKYYAVKKGVKIARQEKVDIIFSTSPPPTVSLIAKEIAEKVNLKWVADFRDPWMEIVHYQNVKRNYFTKLIDGKLEKSVLKKADILVTISKDIVELFKSKVGEKEYAIIPNGFDESDFSVVNKEENTFFTIAYTGVITQTRIPRVLFSALNKLIFTDKIKNIKFNFAGKYCNEFIEEIKKYNLDKYFNLKGFVPHHESTAILQNADILLLIVDNVPNNKGFLTGKLFEYMGTKKPIFAIGPVDGDAHEFIKKSNSGAMVGYDDEEGAYKLLKELYDAWETGSHKFTYDVEQFSRRNLTKKLTEVFNKALL